MGAVSFSFVNMRPKPSTLANAHYHRRKAQYSSSSFRGVLAPISYKNNHKCGPILFNGKQKLLPIKLQVSLKNDGNDSIPISTKLLKRVDVTWRFLRFYALKGTIIGAISMAARVLMENSHLLNMSLMPKLLYGLFSIICASSYIIGINQIYDVEIDRINKPYLPIAAGDLSIPQAWTIVLGCAIMGFSIVIKNSSPFILALYSLGILTGTIYSVPPLRTKENSIAAILTISTYRGFLLTFGVYYSTQKALGLSFQWNPQIMFMTTLMVVVTSVVIITKDITDTEGDSRFGISTLATKFGVHAVTFLGSGLLLASNIISILLAIFMPRAFNQKLMIYGHCTLAIYIVFQTWILEKSQFTKDACARYYMSIWTFYYASYALFPFI